MDSESGNQKEREARRRVVRTKAKARGRRKGSFKKRPRILEPWNNWELGAQVLENKKWGRSFGATARGREKSDKNERRREGDGGGPSLGRHRRSKERENGTTDGVTMFLDSKNEKRDY